MIGLMIAKIQETMRKFRDDKAESSDIDHDLLINTHNLTTDIDHNTTTNTHNLTTDIDHTNILNIGTNTHSDIDTAIADHPHQDVNTTATPEFTEIHLTTKDFSIVDNDFYIELTGDGVIEGGLGISIPTAATKDFYYGYGGTESHRFGTLGEELIINEHGDLTTTGALTSDSPTFFVDKVNHRVGIGTITPTRKLQVVGGDILLDNNEGYMMKDFAGNERNAFRFNTSNNFILGDAATIGGSIYISSQGHVIFFAGAAEKMRLKDNGNLGIGTNAPTIKLDVNTKSGINAIGGFCIKLTNKSGADSVTGKIVIAHTTINDAVAVAGSSDTTAIGVFLEDRIRDGSEVWVVVGGVADVLIDGHGASNGDRIITAAGAASGRGTVNNAPTTAQHFQEIGHCIETTAGSGTGRCVLHFN